MQLAPMTRPARQTAAFLSTTWTTWTTGTSGDDTTKNAPISGSCDWGFGCGLGSQVVFPLRET